MIRTGDLVRSHVVTDLGSVLEDALDRRLDGYAVVSPRDSLLFDDDGAGVLTFERGVPTLVYHTGTDRGGPAALADIGSGPFGLQLYRLDSEDLDLPGDVSTLRVPPGSVAERLVGDGALADRTRRVAPDAQEDKDPVVAFLEEASAIEELQQTAREEAKRRAREWSFEDVL